MFHQHGEDCVFQFTTREAFCFGTYMEKVLVGERSIEGESRWEHLAQDGSTRLLVREFEVQMLEYTALEGRIEVRDEVSGEDDHSLMLLEQYKHLAAETVEGLIGSLLHVLDASAQEGVGFVEEEDAILLACHIEGFLKVLGCFANILGFDFGIVEREQGLMQIVSDGMGAHGLACAWSTVKIQDRARNGIYFAESPLVEDKILTFDHSEGRYDLFVQI